MVNNEKTKLRQGLEGTLNAVKDVNWGKIGNTALSIACPPYGLAMSIYKKTTSPNDSKLDKATMKIVSFGAGIVLATGMVGINLYSNIGGIETSSLYNMEQIINGSKTSININKEENKTRKDYFDNIKNLYLPAISSYHFAKCVLDGQYESNYEVKNKTIVEINQNGNNYSYKLEGNPDIKTIYMKPISNVKLNGKLINNENIENTVKTEIQDILKYNIGRNQLKWKSN